MSRAGSDRRPCCVKCACVCHCGYAVSLCCVWLCPIWSRHNNHFKLSQTQPLGNSWSGVQSPCWVTNTHLHAALPILSQIMRDRVAHILAWWQIFIRTPTVLFNHNKGKTAALSDTRLASQSDDLSALVLEHLLPSAERVTQDRSLYTKMGLRVLGVKVTNQQGPAEKGCASLLCLPGCVWSWRGFWSWSAVTGFANRLLLEGGEKKAAYRCEVNRFIMSSLIRSVYVLN